MKIIRRYGAYVYKNAQNEYTEKGRPDLTACVPVKISDLLKMFGPDERVGIFFGIEMKRPGQLGAVSEAQRIVGNKILKAKGFWFAVDDADLVEALMIKFVGDIEDELQ